MDPILDPILLVDDEKDNLQALQRLLRGLFKVTTTTSPLEALQLMGAHKFHVIVSDQRMPDMSGVELLEKAKKLSPHSTRILLTGYTDIESVIDAINRGHIYRYIAKPWDPEELKLTLKQANEAFQLRRELEEKNRALEKSLNELSLLDKAKARFLSLISHELNTPLTVLQSFMSLLSQSQAELSKDLQTSVSALSGAVHRFSEIVSEVLTYTKLESTGKLKLGQVDLDVQLRKMVETLRSSTSNNRIQLTFASDSVGHEKLDWEKMELALNRIITSIITRTKPDTQINLKAKKNEGHTLLDISWSGEPLPDDAFKPFETGSSEMHHHQNLGLSLAIAKLVIESHGGKIMESHSSATQNSLLLQLK
ncbi:MAG: response regulator [Pseudomonadota bacterium]